MGIIVSESLYNRVSRGLPDTAAARRFLGRVETQFPDMRGTCSTINNNMRSASYDYVTGVSQLIMYLSTNKAKANSWSNNFFQSCREIVLSDAIRNATINNKENTDMNATATPAKPDTKTAIASAYEDMKSAAGTAAQIVAGETAIEAIVSAIRPAAPMIVRGYLDNAFAKAAIANAIAFGFEMMMPSDPRVEKLVQAVRIASFTKLAGDLKVQEMINGVLDSVMPSGK